MIQLADEVLTLQPSDYTGVCKQPYQFFIGVTGFLGEASYTLLVTTGNNDTVLLADGVPQVCWCEVCGAAGSLML